MKLFRQPIFGLATHFRWLRIGSIFAIFLLVGLLKLDNDFGWHLMSGQYILQHGVPATDIFTYTARDFPWINHEWLSDALMALVYQAGGSVLLAVVWAAIWTAAIWLVGRRAHWAVVLLATFAIAPYAGARPLVWTMLGLAATMWVLRASHRRYRWLLPFIFLLWANMHGGFIIGFLYLGYQALRDRSWSIVGVALIAGVVTLGNPYGYGLYTEIFRTLLDGSLRGKIDEWAAFQIPYVEWAYVLVWLLGFLLFSARRLTHYIRFDMLMLIAALASLRNWPLFCFVAISHTSNYLTQYLRQVPPRIDTGRRRIAGSIGTGIAIAAIVCFAVACWQLVQQRQAFPRSEVAYLQQHPCKGNLFNYYDYGGYLLWQLPGRLVYIDGRMPSWQKDGHNYLNDYLRITRDASFRRSQFAQYNITCVLYPTVESLVTQLHREGWQTVSRDATNSLLVY
jgi:hypothetical protein